MNEKHPECRLDPRMPPQREHLPNITRLACEIVQDGKRISFVGRHPKTLEIVEAGEFERTKIEH